MATKKSIPKTSKPATKKATKAKKPVAKKGAADGRDKKGRFEKNHTVNEVWTAPVVLEKLQAIWKTLTTNYEGKAPEDKNIVRANDIKLLGEACLMHSVSRQKWNEWEDKFAPYLKDGVTKNPNFSDAITDIIKNVKWLLECRLNYSGGSMDIFILKNHYQYKDATQVDATTKGESINNPFMEFLKQTGLSNPQKK